jgi:putative ABC transport system ATP-binding protein
MIQLKNITKSFDLNKNKVEVLKGINLQIADDEFIALMGPSGSRKSTLLGIIAGIDSPKSGEIYINGQDISKKKEDELAIFRNENVGIVFRIQSNSQS